MNEAQQLVASQKQQFEDLLNRQKTEQNNLFGQYSGAITSQPKLTDVFTQKQNEAGVGKFRENIDLFNTQISGVKGLLDRLNENTAARTSGTNANQAYLDRLRAVEGGGLNTQLGRLASGLEPIVSAYNTSSDQLGQYMALLQEQQSKELKPLEAQISSVSDRFAREITGFTKSKEDELTVLMDKLQRDRDLADREWKQAAQLAAQENEYQNNRRFLEAQQASSPVANVDTSSDKDAAYVGRLNSLPNSQKATIIDSLRRAASRGNQQAANRLAIGQQLGYW